MAEKSLATKMSRAPSTETATETPEPLFEQIDQIYGSVARRAFELFDGNGRQPGRDVDDWFKAEADLLHPMHVDLLEKNGSLRLRAEVPGFTAKDLEIRLEPQTLTISGKRESNEENKQGKTLYQEHCSDQILRIIHLPAEVEAAMVNATVKDGILLMEMPKGSQRAAQVKITARPA